jgi:hypothetical protein
VDNSVESVPGGTLMDRDLAYFVRRAEQERAAASAASSEQAKRVHILMADCYDAKVQVLSERAAVNTGLAGPSAFLFR